MHLPADRTLSGPTAPLLVEIAVPLPLYQTFTYAVPAGLADRACPGCRVLVPFGRRTVTGYILAPAAAAAGETKEVLEVLDREPLFTPQTLAFYRWAAAYYGHPLGEAIRTALPAGLTIMGKKKLTPTPDGTMLPAEVLTGGQNCKTERVFRPTGQETPPSLKGKGLQIWQLLMAGSEASATDLRRRFGPCVPQLNRLLELGLIQADSREVYRDPFREQVFAKDTPPPLTVDQAAAVDRLHDALEQGSFAPFLLHGVTGSGKTEVYLQSIARCIQEERTALVLVPEIALTPQLVERFKRRFSCGIAVLHSGLSDGERYDEWRRIRRGEASIVIGARSAIFAPLERLGMIVVDEEHEPSYKQSDGFRYNARDLALVLGKMANAVVLLGSATPLVTTLHAVRQGRLALLALPNRVNSLPMPDTRIVDGRGRQKEVLLPELIAALEENLASGGQSLLFLNRRGFATWLVCKACGHVLRCPNCSVTLTFHQQRRRHICHYCDYSIPAPSICPHCESGEIGLLGLGTERLEEEVQGHFPDARVARMDRDTTSGRGGHSRILKQLAEGKVDILIGTQMIAKGHDFPGVTLVGVVSVDATLNLPDFRSSERAFQLVSQVLGRAGRGEQPVRVLVQSLIPDHFALARAVAHDYDGFLDEELAFRQELGYPPFSHLVALQFSSTAASAVEKDADAAAELLRRLREAQRCRVEVLGPATAPLGKVRGRYRWQILLKGTNRQELHRLVQRFRQEFRPTATVRLAVDIDPVELL